MFVLLILVPWRKYRDVPVAKANATTRRRVDAETREKVGTIDVIRFS